jgi:hypothetical protein
MYPTWVQLSRRRDKPPRLRHSEAGFPDIGFPDRVPRIRGGSQDAFFFAAKAESRGSLLPGGTERPRLPRLRRRPRPPL